MFSYILWDQSADLFSWGQFTLRWNGLLLLLAFLVSRIVLGYLYKKEGKPAKDVDLLSAFLIVGSVLGSRLGHVLLYQPLLWSRPLTIFFPFEFKPSFHFTGMAGFSAPGGMIGLLVFAWLYCLKKRPGQRYAEVLDNMSLAALWIAIPMLIGSFMSSEIEGKPTSASFGTVLINPVTRGIEQLSCCIMRNPGGKNPLNQAVAKKQKDIAKREDGHHSIALYLFFKKDTPMQLVDEFMLGDVKTYLYDQSQRVYEPGTEPLHYTIFAETNGDFDVRVRTIGVARYPVQLFETISSLVLFALIFWYWNRHKLKLAPGRIFGLSMTGFWIFRLGYEFIKENQATFIKGMVLNKAQVVCIPLILIGLVMLFRSYRKVSK